MLFQRDPKNLLDVFNQSKIKDTEIFDQIVIADQGKPKTILTIGVREKMDVNLIVALLDTICDHSFAIIVEKPSIYHLNQIAFTEDNLRLCGFDKIQNDLIKRHTNSWSTKGTEIIGAEGKKVFITDQHEMTLSNISLTHKVPEKDYILKIDAIKKMAAQDELYHLAEKIINKCLSFDQDTSFDEIIQQIKQMIHYEDGTNIDAVFDILFKRVSYLSKQLSVNDKANIKSHILEDITQNIFNLLDELNELPEKLRQHTDYLNEKVNLIETIIDDNPEYITYIEANVPLNEIIGEYALGQQDFEAYKEFKEHHNFSAIIDKLSNKLTTELTSRILDEIFTKTCCGLSLYSELLANKKDNLVVIFSPPQYMLLNKFIEKIHRIA